MRACIWTFACKCLGCDSVSPGPSQAAPCHLDHQWFSSPEGLALLTPRWRPPGLGRPLQGQYTTRNICYHKSVQGKATKKTEWWSLCLPHSTPWCAKRCIPRVTLLQRCSWADTLSVMMQAYMQHHVPDLAVEGELLSWPLVVTQFIFSTGIRLPASASNMQHGMKFRFSLFITSL